MIDSNISDQNKPITALRLSGIHQTSDHQLGRSQRMKIVNTEYENREAFTSIPFYIYILLTNSLCASYVFSPVHSVTF